MLQLPQLAALGISPRGRDRIAIERQGDAQPAESHSQLVKALRVAPEPRPDDVVEYLLARSCSASPAMASPRLRRGATSRDPARAGTGRGIVRLGARFRRGFAGYGNLGSKRARRYFPSTGWPEPPTILLLLAHGDPGTLTQVILTPRNGVGHAASSALRRARYDPNQRRRPRSIPLFTNEDSFSIRCLVNRPGVTGTSARAGNLA